MSFEPKFGSKYSCQNYSTARYASRFYCLLQTFHPEKTHKQFYMNAYTLLIKPDSLFSPELRNEKYLHF